MQHVHLHEEVNTEFEPQQQLNPSTPSNRQRSHL